MRGIFYGFFDRLKSFFKWIIVLKQVLPRLRRIIQGSTAEYEQYITPKGDVSTSSEEPESGAAVHQDSFHDHSPGGDFPTMDGVGYDFPGAIDDSAGQYDNAGAPQVYTKNFSTQALDRELRDEYFPHVPEFSVNTNTGNNEVNAAPSAQFLETGGPQPSLTARISSLEERTNSFLGGTPVNMRENHFHSEPKTGDDILGNSPTFSVTSQTANHGSSNYNSGPSSGSLETLENLSPMWTQGGGDRNSRDQAASDSPAARYSVEHSDAEMAD